MDEFRQRFAAFIRDRRLALDPPLTQKALAERLGVQQPAVSAWESGRAVPEFPTLLELAAILEIDLREFGELSPEAAAS